MIEGDHVLVAGGGDEDVGGADHVLEAGDLEALHGGLQRADRVDLGDDHPGALALERLGAALADVAVPGDDCGLAAEHHVDGAVDAVDQAVTAAVQVVELGLGDRVVDVDRREQQLAGLEHLVQPVHPGGGLLGDAVDAGTDLGPAVGVLGQRRLERGQDDLPLVGVVLVGLGHLTSGLVLGAVVHVQGGVAAVVEDHVGATGLGAGPTQRLLGAPPVLLERLALPCEHRHTVGGVGGAVGADGDRGGGVVLGGEDVAAGPAHLGAQGGQRLDQHCGLDRHVQRAGDLRALQRRLVGEQGADGHQAGHLVFGQLDLLAAKSGQREIGNLVVVGGQHVSLLMIANGCATTSNRCGVGRAGGEPPSWPGRPSGRRWQGSGQDRRRLPPPSTG